MSATLTRRGFLKASAVAGGGLVLGFVVPGANRFAAALEDIRAVALPALRHRVLLRLESELDGLDADGTLGSIVDAWRRRL